MLKLWFFSQLFATADYTSKTQTIYSNFLKREVTITTLIPQKKDKNLTNLPLLLINDGQDFEALRMLETLNMMSKSKKIQPILVVGIHANENRMNEYGTASQADYAGRGNQAKQHNDFVIQELLPFLEKNFKLKNNAKHRYFAGFSLGGLSAIDIVWANPSIFSKVGVFSGSLWWRQKRYEDNQKEDNDRIMHNLVKNQEHKKGLKFWFQAGTEDETSDRNNNGIIDAIDDTLDLMQELKKKLYTQKDVTYYEMKGGKHNPNTWAEAMPIFLEWIFRK
ncbi:MAG: esterase family protein [Bacteroidetes bacterium]|nr:MAG: esterase family protein [Bacteroidota bacterium]TAG90234.1 MAG: esterase family protein [Bacteroidota bacterium]